MKRLVIMITPAILVVGLVLPGSNDTDISITHTSISDDKAARSITKAGNCRASATITITMTGILDG
jgi:hypothetical protein